MMTIDDMIPIAFPGPMAIIFPGPDTNPVSDCLYQYCDDNFVEYPFDPFDFIGFKTDEEYRRFFLKSIQPFTTRSTSMEHI